jgi:hypothetical protein
MTEKYIPGKEDLSPADNPEGVLLEVKTFVLVPLNDPHLIDENGRLTVVLDTMAYIEIPQVDGSVLLVPDSELRRVQVMFPSTDASAPPGTPQLPDKT